MPVTTADGSVAPGSYIIGHDPYASDDPNGESLSATYVIKTKKFWKEIGYDEIVAVYVGRPYEGRHVVNENLLKLSMFYGNAKVYFENVRGNVKEYFEKMKRLDLLAKQPRTVFNKKASHRTTPSITYGFPMSNRQMKLDGCQYIRDWLLEERESAGEDGAVIRNLDRIWDRGLLQELIAFNLDENFDRVMGFMGCIIGVNETYNQYKNRIEKEAIGLEDDLDLSFLLSNKMIGDAQSQDSDGEISSLKKKMEDIDLDFLL